MGQALHFQLPSNSFPLVSLASLEILYRRKRGDIHFFKSLRGIDQSTP